MEECVEEIVLVEVEMEGVDVDVGVVVEIEDVVIEVEVIREEELVGVIDVVMKEEVEGDNVDETERDEEDVSVKMEVRSPVSGFNVVEDGDWGIAEMLESDIAGAVVGSSGMVV